MRPPKTVTVIDPNADRGSELAYALRIAHGLRAESFTDPEKAPFKADLILAAWPVDGCELNNLQNRCDCPVFVVFPSVATRAELFDCMKSMLAKKPGPKKGIALQRLRRTA